MKLILVGIRDDNGKIGHVRAFESTTWANKYARSAGEFAVFASVEVEFKSIEDKE